MYRGLEVKFINDSIMIGTSLVLNIALNDKRNNYTCKLIFYEPNNQRYNDLIPKKY